MLVYRSVLLMGLGFRVLYLCIVLNPCLRLECLMIFVYLCDTIDERNPAITSWCNISVFIRFYTSQVVSRISEPSTVWNWNTHLFFFVEKGTSFFKQKASKSIPVVGGGNLLSYSFLGYWMVSWNVWTLYLIWCTSKKIRCSKFLSSEKKKKGGKLRSCPHNKPCLLSSFGWWFTYPTGSMYGIFSYI